MKFTRTAIVLAMLAVPAVPAIAATTATAPTAATGPVTVARYTFDRGATASGLIAELSGRGSVLRIRATNGASVRFGRHGAGRYLAFPALCPSGSTTCGRAILEGANSANLNPGTRAFRWGASINALASQIGANANVMQKGVATTDSQWKLQIGGRGHRAQCVVVGVGSATAYVAKSDIGVVDGHWHQVICTRTATTLTVWVDGRARGRVALPAALSISNALPLRIGGRNLAVTSDSYDGALDDVFAALG